MAGAYIPPALSEGLPRALYAHTADAIDFAALRGKKIAVSAAPPRPSTPPAVALEAGAASVRLFARRPALAVDCRSAGCAAIPAPTTIISELPDAVRWHQAIRFRRAGSTAARRRDRAGAEVREFPSASRRAVAFGAGRGRPDRGARPPTANIDFDFAIAGTGYFVDPGVRPELADFAHHILLWRDRYTPPAGEEDAYLGAHPYLGAGHEYLEKAPGAAPYLKDIHVQNPAGFVSFGVPVGDVPSMKRGLPAVTARISRDLFFADFPAHQQRLIGDVAPEFPPELYAAAVWRAGATDNSREPGK